MRDFYGNKGQKYLPSKRDFTANFGWDVFSGYYPIFLIKLFLGKKCLLPINEVKFIDGVPRYKELSAKRIWAEIRRDKDCLRYFPNPNKCPQRVFLLNVINTIKPQSILKLVIIIYKLFHNLRFNSYNPRKMNHSLNLPQ